MPHELNNTQKHALMWMHRYSIESEIVRKLENWLYASLKDARSEEQEVLSHVLAQLEQIRREEHARFE